MTIDSTSPRSRRALLGAGLGAIAATAASALAGSSVAEASNPVLLGAGNTETTATGITNSTANGTALTGVANSGTSARGILGQSSAGHGVEGASTTGIGVLGHSASRGVQGNSSSGTGVYGISTYGAGVRGQSSGYYGVAGDSPAGGVYGHSSSYDGVHGVADWQSAAGVWGENTSTSYGYGIRGRAAGTYGFGVLGEATAANGVGVQGGASGAGSVGVAGEQGNGASYSGYFYGDVHIDGTLTNPAPIIQMDHPDAPADRYFQRAPVAAFELLSTISGNTVTGADGRVTVKVPLLFARYHTDVRYQLTPLGHSTDLHVAVELDGRGRFVIAADQYGLRVSWQLTGVRSDPAALRQPLRVDATKPVRYRGRYVQPSLYGQPRSRSLIAPRPAPKHPRAPRRSR